MFARQCPLIELADTAMESWGDLWVLFLGRKGRGSEDLTSFQQDASGYASVAHTGNLVVRYLAHDYTFFVPA